MKLQSYQLATSEQKKILSLAKKTSAQSIVTRGHKVGCVIVTSDKVQYVGATVARGRAIGSTCAERMALDQWYVHRGKHPEASLTCYVTGTFQRPGWSNGFLCTPCGVCLEMFLELITSGHVKTVKFVCADWNLTKVLVASIDHLFPQIGKGKWPYHLDYDHE